MSDYSSGPAACAHGVLFTWSCQLCGRVGRTADHSPGAAVVIAQLTAERDSLAADLAALRGRVGGAVAHCQRERAGYWKAHDNDSAGALSNVLAILAPPEGPQ